jgi:DNA-binding transcriptional MerR regulator
MTLMTVYTLKEAAKMINVPAGAIRQWEKELYGLIEIPRSRQGARIYTDSMVELFMGIKEQCSMKANKVEIRSWVQQKLHPEPEMEEPTVEHPSEYELVAEPIPSLSMNQTSSTNAEQFLAGLESFKQNFISDLKDEVRTVIRKELLAEVKKELNNNTLTTVKKLSDSIYKSSENTKAGLEDLADKVEKINEETIDSIKYLSNRMTSASVDTSEEIYHLSKQLAATSEELTKYVDNTNNEIYSLTEELSKDRDYFIEEREHYRDEVRQREAAFQNMLISFRDAASAKEKKWWKFWA